MNRQKRVAIDARLIEKAGIGRYLKNLIQGLIEGKNYELTLLGHVRDQKTLSSFHPDSLIYLESPIYSVREQLELKRKIPPCDLFFSPHFNVPLFSIPAKKRLTTIHDVFHLAHFNTLTLTQKAYASFFYRKAVKLSDRIITVSSFSKDELIRYVKAPVKKIEVIPNSLGKNLFYPCLDDEKKRAFLKKYKLPEKFVLALGNVKPHKNLFRLLCAYESINSLEELVIVGRMSGFITEEKDLFNYIKTRPHLQERVHLVGMIPDEELALLYSSARALLFPSLYEGFGFPPVEAIACGCPVLASNSASLPEVLGDAALYVDPLDVASIRRGISQILVDDKKRLQLIERGFERAKSFAPEKMVASHQALIEELIQ